MAWLVNWLRDVPLSIPELGVFDINCPQLSVKTGDVCKIKNCISFCIPLERLDDLLLGESARGGLQGGLLSHNTYKDIDGNVVGAYLLCPHGKERKRVHQEKAARPVVLEKVEGIRRSGVELGATSKLGCEYSLTWRQFQRDEQSVAGVVVKNKGFHGRQGETNPIHGPDSNIALRVGLKLSPECRSFVWQELEQRSTQQQIIQRNRDRLRNQLRHLGSNNSEIDAAIVRTEYARDFALNRRDISNIAVDVARGTFRRHDDDATSVSMLWEEEQHKPVEARKLLYADVSTDEPLVIIASADMLKWAEAHGHNRPVSMDCTFGITKYGYSLCTLTALNGQGRGVPICVAIMKREREQDFAAVIRALKEKLSPQWRPSIFLADCAEAEHNGIRAVFGESMPIHLCTYHVVTAWYKGICQHVVSEGQEPLKETIKRIFKGVHAVMKHPGADTLQASQEAVRAAMAEFKQAWEHQEGVLQYFKQWESIIDMWALGVRKFDKSLNQRTTGLSEGWNRKLKRHLGGCPSVHQRRVDWVIDMLGQLIDDGVSTREFLAYEGFGYNSKAEDTIKGSLRKMSLLDVRCMTLSEGNARYVSDSATYDLPDFTCEYGCCDCMHAIDGFFCKHQLLALWVMCFGYAEVEMGSMCKFQRMCIRQLGTEFEKRDGCSKNCIQPLVSRLKDGFVKPRPDAATLSMTLGAPPVAEMHEPAVTPPSSPSGCNGAPRHCVQLTPSTKLMQQGVDALAERFTSLMREALDPNTTPQVRRQLAPLIETFWLQAQHTLKAGGAAAQRTRTFQLPAEPQSVHRKKRAGEPGHRAHPFSKTNAVLSHEARKLPSSIEGRLDRAADNAQARALRNLTALEQGQDAATRGASTQRRPPANSLLQTAQRLMNQAAEKRVEQERLTNAGAQHACLPSWPGQLAPPQPCWSPALPTTASTTWPLPLAPPQPSLLGARPNLGAAAWSDQQNPRQPSWLAPCPISVSANWHIPTSDSTARVTSQPHQPVSSKPSQHMVPAPLGLAPSQVVRPLPAPSVQSPACAIDAGPSGGGDPGSDTCPRQRSKRQRQPNSRLLDFE